MQSSDPFGEGGLPQVVRRLQIVVGSLVVGCILFLVVALVLSSQGGAPLAGGNTRILTQFAVGLALLALVVRSVIPGAIVAYGRRKILQETSSRGPQRGRRRAPNLVERVEITSKLWAIWTTRTIVAGAILEGAAFFALVAYVVERSPWSLAVAIGLILALIVQIPTRSGLMFWTANQLLLLDEERSLGRSP